MVKDIACLRSFNLKIKEDDIDREKFPKKFPKDFEKLQQKIHSVVANLMEGVEQWQLVSVNESVLQNLAENARKKSWRKKHETNTTLVNPDELNFDDITKEVRADLRTENFQNWSVSWVNFFLKSKKKWRILVATIYTIAQKRKILLHKEIAENPIIAHKFLEFLNKQNSTIASPVSVPGETA